MYVYIYLNFLTQRNCHRNIYNQFSRGLSLHCPWQQDLYHGCGKSETAGQDNAGTRWLNDYWKATIFHFSMLCWSQIPCTLSVSLNLSLWSACCYSEIWYMVWELVGGSDPEQCLLAPAENSLDGSLQAYLEELRFWSHVFTVTTWFCLEKHSSLEWKRLCWCRFVKVCYLNIKDVSVHNFLFPRYHFLLVISAIKALEFTALW